MIPVQSVLAAISARRGDAVMVPTMMTARSWPKHTSNVQLDLPVSNCMGKASSVGLGVALARPDRRVIVLDGDGSLLMNLGSMVTIANARPANLIHFVFENGVYEITGSQPVPGEGTFNFATIARGAGYQNVFELNDEATLEATLDEALSKPGPTFIVARVTEVGYVGPAPARRTAVAFHEVRAALAEAQAPRG